MRKNMEFFLHHTQFINDVSGILVVFYIRYVGDIFVLFRKEEHLNLFLNYFNSCYENIKFTSEEETNNKLSFLDWL